MRKLAQSHLTLYNREEAQKVILGDRLYIFVLRQDTYQCRISTYEDTVDGKVSRNKSVVVLVVYLQSLGISSVVVNAC